MTLTGFIVSKFPDEDASSLLVEENWPGFLNLLAVFHQVEIEQLGLAYIAREIVHFQQ